MNWLPPTMYSYETFREEARELLGGIENCSTLEEARRKLFDRVSAIYYDVIGGGQLLSSNLRIRLRDCVNAFQGMLLHHSAKIAGFDMAQALWDIARQRPRPDLQPGFWADMIYLTRALNKRAAETPVEEDDIFEELSGREAAIARSSELDELWHRVMTFTARYTTGLTDESRQRRSARRKAILEYYGATLDDWHDWKWQCAHIIKDGATLQKIVRVSEEQAREVELARSHRLPFGITPYYASLMDDDYESGRDRCIRAQVLPPHIYVEQMSRHRHNRDETFDFMREKDTSPVELITRRYPAIVILKPFNTCPQICVYCQRNWEIEEAMACDAESSPSDIRRAIQWIAERPTVREVLITGGDPLALNDRKLKQILDQVSAIEHVDLIRIGSRTLVTMPMRITEKLGRLLGSYRELGKRDICVVTHFEHPYEITPDVVLAANRLKKNGISIYNQQVFTFYVSRRFETVALRMLLRRIGIDPYYTFVPKGKDETSDYLVPLARVLQERKEEARLLPGIRRTDEPVYNVPRLGKNHIRARQSRDLLAIKPDGSRVYEYHPWEKYIVERDPYVAESVPILDYLLRLEKIGENPDDYMSIWYYF